MTRPLQDKIAVVTGASRGIGYATAKSLAAQGAHIIAVARTVGGLEELDDEIKSAGGSATLVPLDLVDFDAIDRMGAKLFERWKRLDILVANAGVLDRLTPLGHMKPEQWDNLMSVNVTANWRLIRSFDPLLRASDAGRAIFVTADAAHKHTAYWGGYATSKAALEALVLTYAAECATTSIRVNLVNPGTARTALRARAMPGEDPDTIPAPSVFANALVKAICSDSMTSGVIYDLQGDVFAARS